MPHRTFRDRNGLEWQVWDVMPDSNVGVTLGAGWLTFLSGEDKRRLAPVPLYWVNAPEPELALLLESAKQVGVRVISPSDSLSEAPPAEERA